MKKIPQRTCLGCNEAKPKNELIRIVKQSDGKIFVDKTGKAEGRGAYICMLLPFSVGILFGCNFY